MWNHWTLIVNYSKKTLNKITDTLIDYLIESVLLIKDIMIALRVDYIKPQLPKIALLYSWRKGKLVIHYRKNFEKYFMYVLIAYFLIHILISKVNANETFLLPKTEITQEEIQHDNALVPKTQDLYNSVVNNDEQYKKVIQNIDNLNNKQTYELSRTISPKESGNQYCYTTITITQENNSVIKKENLECADGRKGLLTPGYWELFAQFYYRDVATPEYCRFYTRPDHAFKTFGKVCLNKEGEWRVVN
jgi:hypothetical protein